MNSKNVVNNVGIFNDNVVVNSVFSEQYEDEQCLLWIMSGWTMILVNSAGSVTPPKFQSVSLNVWVVNEYTYFCLGRL